METDVLKALLPAFAAGFANQRLMEILDPALESLAGEKRKRISIGVFSVVVGVLFALGGRLRTLEYLGAGYPNYWFTALDVFVTGLIISAGTEGFNSILKFLSYKKEETKTSAVASKLGVSKFLPPKTTFDEALALSSAAEEIEFTPGEAMLVAYKSVTTTTGSGEPITPTATLAKYNARDPDIPAIRNRVINNAEFGLAHYGRSMNANALKDLDTSWTLQDLADVTFEESFVV